MRGFRGLSVVLLIGGASIDCTCGRESRPVEIGRPPDPEAGCDGTQFVALRPAGRGSCPTLPPVDATAGRWVESEVMGTGAVTRSREQICSYRWVPARAARPSDTDRAPIARLVEGSAPEFSRAGESCANISALAGTVPTTVIPHSRAAFKKQSEAADDFVTGGERPKIVRVAVVDTLPDGDGIPQLDGLQFQHGRTVGLVIRDLACPQASSCVARMTTHLAFDRHDNLQTPIRRPQPRTVGTQADVATAIHNAVTNWLEDSGREEHLVINLSLGWNGQPIESETATAAYPPASAAVWRAIAAAGCHGALVVAAAGNTTNGPKPLEGPMFPAAWERQPGLTAAECMAEFGITTGAAHSGARVPFLLSAGGLDGRDAAVSNARPKGRPRLAAPAQHVTVVDNAPPAFASVMTGSSMSTAVASAAAAIAWAYHPNATVEELGAILYDSTIPLAGQTADYCFSGAAPCGTIGRISICGVMKRVCPAASPNARCPPAGIRCQSEPAFTDRRIKLPAAAKSTLLSAVPPAPPFAAGLATTAVAECGGDVVAPVGSNGQPCPSKQFYNSVAAPAVYPQPEEVPCRVCVLVQKDVDSYDLFISISPNFPNGTQLFSGSIRAIYSTGVEVMHDLSSLPALGPGGETQTHLAITSKDFDKATISFVVQQPAQEKYSTEDPLVID